MYRFLSLLVCLCGIAVLFSCHSEERTNETETAGVRENNIISLSMDRVYFFYQETCPHCHEAAAYLHEKHPNAKIKALNIKMPGNMNLFTEAVQTYNIGSQAGTPLICFGKQYIMGWSPEDRDTLDKLIPAYE